MIGSGVTGLFALPAVSEAERLGCERILQAVGSTVWVADESQIDAVTAISGSGPAYVFLFIEALQQAAQSLSLMLGKRVSCRLKQCSVLLALRRNLTRQRRYCASE